MLFKRSANILLCNDVEHHFDAHALLYQMLVSLLHVYLRNVSLIRIHHNLSMKIGFLIYIGSTSLVVLGRRPHSPLVDTSCEFQTYVFRQDTLTQAQAATSTVNTSTCIAKDRAFAKLFGASVSAGIAAVSPIVQLHSVTSVPANVSAKTVRFFSFGRYKK